MVPESRKEQALVLEHTVEDNIAISSLGAPRRAGVLRRERIRSLATAQMERLRLRLNALRLSVRALSGGNQQKAVLARWLARPVAVAAEPDETIFPGQAAKTVEFHTERDRAMIWWTSAPSGAFQIVQRRQSGWVNWGSNAEDECPELPVGVEIKTAYGPFRECRPDVADRLESPPVVSV